MTIDQEIDLALGRVKDKGLRDALHGLHMAMHRRAHRLMAKQASGYRHMEMTANDTDKD